MFIRALAEYEKMSNEVVATEELLRESPLENLRMIRREGMEAFLDRERWLWSCPSCGSPICVHTGVCSGCKARIESKR